MALPHTFCHIYCHARYLFWLQVPNQDTRGSGHLSAFLHQINFLQNLLFLYVDHLRKAARCATLISNKWHKTNKQTNARCSSFVTMVTVMLLRVFTI